MALKKKSFFDRLSGSDDGYDTYDDDFPAHHGAPARSAQPPQYYAAPQPVEEEPSEGQLPVDVYQTPNEIVIRAFVAGVRADELSVSISRDMVVIEGMRAEQASPASDSDFYTRELFWGSFSRTIVLPEEIDVDTSTAASKDGLLTLTLPKHDKARQTKLKVKAG